MKKTDHHLKQKTKPYNDLVLQQNERKNKERIHQYTVTADLLTVEC